MGRYRPLFGVSDRDYFRRLETFQLFTCVCDADSFKEFLRIHLFL